jgi:predicted DNA-binding WGR domain protein
MSALELRLIDPLRNRFRIYRLGEQPTLFGEEALVVEWGRIGGRLRVRSETFAERESLSRRRRELLARRHRHGYVEMTLLPW